MGLGAVLSLGTIAGTQNGLMEPTLFSSLPDLLKSFPKTKADVASLEKESIRLRNMAKVDSKKQESNGLRNLAAIQALAKKDGRYAGTSEVASALASVQVPPRLREILKDLKLSEDDIKKVAAKLSDKMKADLNSDAGVPADRVWGEVASALKDMNHAVPSNGLELVAKAMESKLPDSNLLSTPTVVASNDNSFLPAPDLTSIKDSDKLAYEDSFPTDQMGQQGLDAPQAQVQTPEEPNRTIASVGEATPLEEQDPVKDEAKAKPKAETPTVQAGTAPLAKKEIASVDSSGTPASNAAHVAPNPAKQFEASSPKTSRTETPKAVADQGKAKAGDDDPFMQAGREAEQANQGAPSNPSSGRGLASGSSALPFALSAVKDVVLPALSSGDSESMPGFVPKVDRCDTYPGVAEGRLGQSQSQMQALLKNFINFGKEVKAEAGGPVQLRTAWNGQVVQSKPFDPCATDSDTTDIVRKGLNTYVAESKNNKLTSLPAPNDLSVGGYANYLCSVSRVMNTVNEHVVSQDGKNYVIDQGKATYLNQVFSCSKPGQAGEALAMLERVLAPIVAEKCGFRPARVIDAELSVNGERTNVYNTLVDRKTDPKLRAKMFREHMIMDLVSHADKYPASKKSLSEIDNGVGGDLRAALGSVEGGRGGLDLNLLANLSDCSTLENTYMAIGATVMNPNFKARLPRGFTEDIDPSMSVHGAIVGQAVQSPPPPAPVRAEANAWGVIVPKGH